MSDRKNDGEAPYEWIKKWTPVLEIIDPDTLGDETDPLGAGDLVVRSDLDDGADVLAKGDALALVHVAIVEVATGPLHRIAHCGDTSDVEATCSYELECHAQGLVQGTGGSVSKRLLGCLIRHVNTPVLTTKKREACRA